MLSCVLGRTDIGAPIFKRHWRQVLLGPLVSAACIAAILYLVKPQELLQALRLGDYRLAIVGAFVTVGWLLMRALVWRNLLQEKAAYSQVFFTLNEGYLLNNLLPFRLGEVGRAFLLKRKTGVDFSFILSTIALERAFDLLLASGAFLCALPFAAGANIAPQAALLPGGLVMAGLIFIYVLARRRQRAQQLFEQATRRWPVLHRLGGRVLEPFLAGLAVLTQRRRFLLNVIFFALNLGIGFLQYYTLLRAFFPQAPLVWAVFCLGASSLGMALPASPGSLGVFEGAIVGALAALSLDTSAEFRALSLAYALTLHVWNYVITGSLGAYGLARDGESLTGLFQRLKSPA